jgi:hypothetical protein
MTAALLASLTPQTVIAGLDPTSPPPPDKVLPVTPTRWCRGAWRGDVVDHTVDAAHLVDDAVRHPAEKLHVEVEEVGGHAAESGERMVKWLGLAGHRNSWHRPKVAEHLIERVGAAVREASCRICIAVQVQPLLGVAASATVEAG